MPRLDGARLPAAFLPVTHVAGTYPRDHRIAALQLVRIGDVVGPLTVPPQPSGTGVGIRDRTPATGLAPSRRNPAEAALSEPDRYIAGRAPWSLDDLRPAPLATCAVP